MCRVVSESRTLFSEPPPAGFRAQSRRYPDLLTGVIGVLPGVTHNVTAMSEERSLEDHRGTGLRWFIL